MPDPLVLSVVTGIGLMVDPQDQWLVDLGGWYLCNGYARRDFWKDGQKRRIYLHRVIAGPPEGMHVDHTNGNKLDNRRSNLRWATRSQNLQNRRGATRHHRSTGIRGVYVDKRDGAIYARLKINGRAVNLGRFTTVQDARLSVENARSRLMTHSSECMA